ncbi:hypothetical protein MANES_01G220201v8 [Manihot esculenta]|uniref:Uncharacterized protein n=1 Tax=Manihot esculenta TaxID=3983 RepID=A0A2C9WMX0_MANES|nr:hypothetical protein MANES_01G220201v8 [Manihot esculenta]
MAILSSIPTQRGKCAYYSRIFTELYFLSILVLFFKKIDIERHAGVFMEVAEKLQLCLIGSNEIDVMEEEVQIKDGIIKKQETWIQGWRKELKDQLDKHKTELERL